MLGGKVVKVRLNDPTWECKGDGQWERTIQVSEGEIRKYGNPGSVFSVSLVVRGSEEGWQILVSCPIRGRKSFRRDTSMGGAFQLATRAAKGMEVPQSGDWR